MPAHDIAVALRALAATISRRGLLAAGALLLAVDDIEGKQKRKKNRQKKRRENAPQVPALPPGPVPKVAAVCTGSGESNIGGSGSIRVAQTFTALASGPLGRVDVLLTKLVGSLGEYILQVGSVDAFGVPTNEVLAATAVANLTVPNGRSTVTFTFGNPATVAAGVQYALVLSRPDSTHLQWQGQEGDVCAGRAFASPSQTAEFIAAGVDFDLVFTAFARS
jgi:hypothetical protein